MTSVLVLAALLAGAALGYFAPRFLPARPPRHAPPLMTGDLAQLVDLARRAHRAICASLVTTDDAPVTAEHLRGAGRETVGRCEALARLALGDGRQHVVEGREVALAVAEGDVGLAMIFPDASHTEEAVDKALVELRRLAAAVHAQRIRERRALPRRSVGAIPHDTPESIGQALCEQAQRIADRPAAVATRDPLSGLRRIIAVSGHADRRLAHTTVAPDSVVGRAFSSEQAIVGSSSEELFGHYRPDRRRQEDEGIAFPLREGESTVAVLVVFGRPRTLPAPVREMLFRKATDTAPRMAEVLAVQAAELLAATDELTGLRNRRAFEAAKEQWQRMAGPVGEREPVALVCVDLDRFKQLNDRHGHEAGDAVLRHVARLFREALRGGDMAVRMGGEEFALWLPGADLTAAAEVAERVRAVVERTPCYWGGTQLAVTCSAGVAGLPASTTSVDNLYGLADAALYRAKQGGRNRVEVARRAEGPLAPAG